MTRHNTPHVLLPTLPVGYEDCTVLADNLRMAYGGQTVLDVPNYLCIGKGITTLTGDSGSGKSTLLNILAGFIKPTEGNVAHYEDGELSYRPDWACSGSRYALRRMIGRILPQFPIDAKTAAHRSKNMGYISQQPALHPHLTMQQYIGLTHAARGNELDPRYVNRLTHQLGITALLSKKPSQLSGGEEQRGAIVAALAHRPKLVFADEPTSALDPESSVRTMELFRAIADESQASFVIVSHDPRIEGYADLTIRLRQGTLVQ